MVRFLGFYRLVSGTTNVLPLLLMGTILALTNQRALLLSPGGLACERVRPSLRRATRDSRDCRVNRTLPPHSFRRRSARRGAMPRLDSAFPAVHPPAVPGACRSWGNFPANIIWEKGCTESTQKSLVHNLTVRHRGARMRQHSGTTNDQHRQRRY